MIKNRTGKEYIPFITGIDYSSYFFFILESISLYDPDHRIPRKFLLFQIVYMLENINVQQKGEGVNNFATNLVNYRVGKIT